MISKIDRRIRDIREHLSPTSDFHKKASEPDLKAYVRKIADLAARSPQIVHGVEWELGMASKGILQEEKPRVVKKEKKPDLVMDNDEYAMY
jgi:hypothetical protein